MAKARDQNCVAVKILYAGGIIKPKPLAPSFKTHLKFKLDIP